MLTACIADFLRREGALFHQLQLEQRCRANDFLGSRDVGDPWKLNQNLVSRALSRDDRLGDAQLVHPALDRLERLRDGLFPELHGQVRPHGVGVTARAGRAGEHGIHLNGRRPESLIVLNPFDNELGRGRDLELGVLDSSGRKRLAQALHRCFRLDPQRGVSLHTHDHVHAALEVEAKIHLRAWWVERPDRQADDGHDDEDFPA